MPYLLIRLIEGFLDLLPRFLARPLMYIIVFVHFRGEWILTLFLPSACLSAIAVTLLDELPPKESIPATLALAGVLALCWQTYTFARAIACAGRRTG